MPRCGFNLLVPAIFLFFSQLLCAQQALEIQDWPAGSQTRRQLPNSRALEYEFSSVDISKLQQWIAWIGYELPVDLSGKVSGWLWAQRSQTSWFEFGEYRLEGEISSPALVVDDWNFRDAMLRFGYAEGTWYVGQLSGKFSSNKHQEDIGDAKFSAMLPTAEPRNLQISGGISDLRLEPLASAFSLDVQVDNIPGSMTFSGQAPLRSLADLSQWSGQAELTLEEIVVAGAPQASIRSEFRLIDGQWTTRAATLEVAEQILQLTAKGTFQDDFPFQAEVKGEDLALREILNSARQDSLANLIEGLANLSMKWEGNGRHGLESATVEVQAPRLKVAQDTLRNVSLSASARRSSAETLPLEIVLRNVDVAGGRIHGKLSWNDLTAAIRAPQAIGLEIEHLQLSDVESLQLPLVLRGMADGQLRFTTSVANDGLDWSSESRLRLANLNVAGTSLGSLYCSASKLAQNEHLSLNVHNEIKSLVAALKLRFRNIQGESRPGSGNAARGILGKRLPQPLGPEHSFRKSARRYSCRCDGKF